MTSTRWAERSDPVLGESTDEPIVDTIAIGRTESISLSVQGLLLSFLALAAGTALFDSAGQSVASSLMLLVTFVLTIVLHELVHGAFFRLFGGRPTFGVGITHFLPYAYATSVGDRFSARQMYTIAIAPLVIVSSLAIGVGLLVPALAAHALLALVTNVGGAIGDLWMMREMRRYTKYVQARFEDARDGLIVRSNDLRAHDISIERHSRSDSGPSFMVRFVAAAMAITFLSLMVPAVLVALDVTESIQIGPDWFPLVQHAPVGDSLTVDINLLPAIVGGLLFAGFGRRINTLRTTGR